MNPTPKYKPGDRVRWIYGHAPLNEFTILAVEGVRNNLAAYPSEHLGEKDWVYLVEKSGVAFFEWAIEPCDPLVFEIKRVRDEAGA